MSDDRRRAPRTWTALAAALLALAAPAAARAAEAFSFSAGAPDGRMAMASRPDAGGIEAADDVTLARETLLTHAAFTGLVPSVAAVQTVELEVYRVVPADFDANRALHVPTRAGSPSDTAFASRDAGSGLSFTATVLSGMFTASNSVRNGINPQPGQTTGGEGAVSGMEVRFDVTLGAPVDLPAGQYFVVPRVGLSSGDFYWLSSARPNPSAPGSDLQAWIRNDLLAPDWLRVGTDIVGGTTPPTFNASFSLSGTLVCPPIAVAPASAPRALRGAPYGVAVSASGGTPPYAFSASGALPPGLALVTGGALVGTPAVAGAFPLGVTATDANGCTGSTALTIAVDAPSSAAPILDHLTVSPAAFVAGHRPAGAHIRFTLNAPARVRIGVERLRRHHPPRVLRGGFSLAGMAGVNRAPFGGRLGGHALAPGRYRLVATPAGGRARRTAFRILAP